MEICSCENPKLPNLGRPNCVIEMRAISFPILFPRYKANGDRNTIDLTSPTLGDDIKALIQASTALLERIYPFPRCENITFERSETVYETAPSTRKYKIPGVGGVRTFKFETWGKDAVHQILRELEKVGCTDLDFVIATVDGNLWGILDDAGATDMRGYEMATETFDAFKEYATDTTTQKIMTSWDLDNAELESNAYAITSEQLGYKSTTLTGLVSGFQTATELDATHIQTVVFTGFGAANAAGQITGLLIGNFTVLVNGVAIVPVGSVETSPGTYSIEHADIDIAPTDVVVVEVSGVTGYDVADGTFVATL